MENKSIIIIAITIIAICIIGCAASYYIITQQNNMKTLDFGKFTMSVPANVNLINNSSDLEGGCEHWIDPNNNDTKIYYSDESSWFGVGASKGAYDTVTSADEQITSDKLTLNNVTMCKDYKKDKTVYMGYYQGNGFSITVRADSLNHLVEMFNSLQLKN